MSLGERFLEFYFYAFGDFGSSDANESIVAWSMFIMSTLLICLIMMNLLIGLISEKLGEELENHSKLDY
jgi:hypothetical protein